MGPNDPLISYSCHVVELPRKRVVHVVVFSVTMDSVRTVLYEADFDLPVTDMQPPEWRQAMEEVLMQVEAALSNHP